MLRPSLFVLILLDANGAVGKAILRPSPIAVLKLRGGGLVPPQKLGTALRPVTNQLAAGWNGWCTLTARVCVAGTGTALTWLASDARTPGYGRNILLKLRSGVLLGFVEVAKTLALLPLVVCPIFILVNLATNNRAGGTPIVREVVMSQLMTSWSRLWSGFRFASGVLASSGILVTIQRTFPPQYQKLLHICCACVLMGASILSGVMIGAGIISGPDLDPTFLEMALYIGLATAVKVATEDLE